MRAHQFLGAALAGAVVLACGNAGSEAGPGSGGAATAGAPATSGGRADGSTGGSSGALSGQGGSTASGGDDTGGAKASGGSADSGSAGEDGASGGSSQSGGSGGAAETGGTTAEGGTSEGGAATGGAATAGAATGGNDGGPADPVPSEGCSLATASTLDGLQTFDVEGTERQFIIRLPDGYDGTVPNRIIFAFHGAAGSADQVDKGDPPNPELDPTGPYYGIREHADDRTIFVAGQAMGSWGAGDIAYAEALVTKLEAELCLDQNRILATGFSMGGIMTVRVACNLSEIFRAVAPMSCSLSAADCSNGGGPVAYWSSHGEQDGTITLSNGEAARDEFVERNGCDAGAAPMSIGENGCVAYQDCDEGYPVNWCPFMGIHEPPTFSGPEIWAFLSQF